MDSDEVVQIYAHFPESQVERPNKGLKAFRRVHIPAGTSQTVTIPLKAEELRYWDVKKHAFVLEPGPVELLVGASSADIRLRGTIRTR